MIFSTIGAPAGAPGERAVSSLTGSGSGRAFANGSARLKVAGSKAAENRSNPADVKPVNTTRSPSGDTVG